MFSSSGSQVSGDSGPVFIEDVFSTTLYAGNSSAQTITNNINLSTKGGLVWLKSRTSASGHFLTDTVRGTNKIIESGSTGSQYTSTDALNTFNTNGFSLGSGNSVNTSGDNYVSWTFRKQPKFFDIVTWTGNSDPARTISHNLGSVPGCILVKETGNVRDWVVYHTSTGNTKYLTLNSASPAGTQSFWYNTSPTSTVFSVNGDWNAVNGSGRTYVAYLFADNAGGFGLTGTDSVISCGVFNTPASADLEINLGWQPQWLMVKQVDSTASGFYDNWSIIDTMRGMSLESSKNLYANPGVGGVSAYIEQDWPSYDSGILTANGFIIQASANPTIAASQRAIYIAIRRPMKVPTDATKVFGMNKFVGNGSSNRILTTSNLTDLSILKGLDSGSGGSSSFTDRMRGGGSLALASQQGDMNTYWSLSDWMYLDVQTGIKIGASYQYNNVSSGGFTNYSYTRAPNFFDVVPYKGTGPSQIVPHGLGVAPELVIVKRRNVTSDTTGWLAAAKINSTQYTVGASGNELLLNSSGGGTTTYYTYADYFSSTTFKTGAFWTTPDVSGGKYIAYLFATCPGVSKVGSYTGTGSLQTINCGFTAGARFVMIKRIDASGDWFVYDSVNGITSGNDPYTRINVFDIQISGTDFVDTNSTGFKVTSSGSINASGGTFIFLAIA